MFDQMRLARYITKMDFKNAYYQNEMDEINKKYIEFGVQELWQFRRIPFGLTHAVHFT